MDLENLKLVVGNRISEYRRRSGLTQAELAEKLNYSDKAVSKWERGESQPDLMTMAQMAELFGVTVDDLMTDSGEKPGPMKKEKKKKRIADRRVIQRLASILVWFVALLVYVILSSVGIHGSWVAFIYAVPVNAIVLLSLRSAWHHFEWNPALISVIMWGVLLSLHVTLLLFAHANVWKLYLLGIPGQIAVFWWFRMFRAMPKEDGDE